MNRPSTAHEPELTCSGATAAPGGAAAGRGAPDPRRGRPQRTVSGAQRQVAGGLAVGAAERTLWSPAVQESPKVSDMTRYFCKDVFKDCCQS